MARLRSIHIGLWSDETWVSLPPLTRCFAISLLVMETDRKGVFEWRPETLKLRLLPADEVNVSALLDTLKAAGIIIEFRGPGDRRLGAFPGLRGQKPGLVGAEPPRLAFAPPWSVP